MVLPYGNNMFDDLKVLYTEDEIQNRIMELAARIDGDYANCEDVVVVSILNGAMFFTIDLLKKMKTCAILDTLQASSYLGTESTDNVIIKKDIDVDIKGKDVIIVEDIIDSGRTLQVIKEHLLKKEPKSLKIAVLLDKPERRKYEVDVDYVGYTIPNKFVVGYGFDVDGKGRNIPYIGYIDN